MLNLSQIILTSSEISLIKKIKRLIEPDIYIASNISDYKTSIDGLNYPWYKGLPVPDRVINPSLRRYHIILNNLGITLLEEGDSKEPQMFDLHDSSGHCVVPWFKRTNIFQPYRSFEELQQEQGLKEDDWVHEVYILHWIEDGVSLPMIAHVKKNEFISALQEEGSIREKTKVMPALLQPSY